MKAFMALFISKISIILVTILIAQPASAEISVKDLETCSYSGGAVTDWNLNTTYIFRGSKVYKIDLPKSGEFRSLPDNAFPELKGKCFSQTFGGPAAEPLAEPIKSDCKTRAKSFAPVETKKLKDVAKAIVEETFQQTEELTSAFYGTDAKDKKFARDHFDKLDATIKGCEALGKLDEITNDSIKDIRVRLTEMRGQPTPGSAAVSKPASGSAK